jgi:hypothetical protein
MGPGEWTIRQIVHHLADDGDVWCMVLKKAIATPGVPIRFEGFPGNEVWAAALAFDKRSVEPVLALLKAHREMMTSLLTYFPEAWERCVSICDDQGRKVQDVSVGLMTRFLGEHVDGHIAVIQAIKHKYGL